MRISGRKKWVTLSVLLGLTMLDRIIKLIAMKATPSIYLNEGVAFSLLSGRGIPLSVLGVVFLVAVSRLLPRGRRDILRSAALLFLWAGAIGNLWDRLLYGGVIDYLMIRLPILGSLFMNLADLFIVIGGLLALLAL